MAEMQGFTFPRTASGNSSVIPEPPWHYSGDLLTVEYRTDPANVAALLPPELDLADEDPGAVAFIWADWQSCGDDFSELLDPVRAQYKEAFVVIRCKYQAETYSRCPFIWVDKDFALVRGYHQGYPKKLGEIWQTRPVTVGKAGPRLAPGGKFGASVSAYGRRIAEARLTITGESQSNGFVNGHPMIHNRIMPRIESDGTDALNELVTMSGFDADLGQCYEGDAQLELFEAPREEIAALPVAEIIGGYFRQVGVSWNGGTTLPPTPPSDS